MHLRSVLLTFMLVQSYAYAEPWLSNRYAQNCAACHAPGRVNRVASERRCTLTCQGCHVSPQGGGMRNQYGIWNQQRWLRSSRFSVLRDKGTPAPLSKQAYYDELKKVAASATTWYGGKPPNDTRAPQQVKSSGSKKNSRRTLVIREVSPPNHLYDQHSSSEWRAVVTDDRAISSVIPRDDPYWLERKTSVYASGDFRYFILNSNKAFPGGDNKTAFTLMAADLGVRLRPFATHKFSGVVEARFLNGPDDQKPEEGFDQAQVKSAYLLVDDLAYNSYAMGGLYRPSFGNYDPDHNSLANEMTGLNQNVYFRGVSVGTAPNVPFLILNYLKPYKDTGQEFQTTDGYVVTVGGRFVSYGLSAAASMWKTTFQESGQLSRSTRDMMAFTAGGTYARYIVNFEFVRAQLNLVSTGKKNAGNVMTVQNKLRLIKENYLVLNYATSNVYRTTLVAGSGTETMVGIKSFPISNLEIEGLYVMREDKSANSAAVSNKLIQLQLHAFF